MDIFKIIFCSFSKLVPFGFGSVISEELTANNKLKKENL